MTNKHKKCCKKMEYHTTNHCTIHDNPFDCPDCLVFYDDTRNAYGIIIHDGSESYVEINYCPWCGKRLPRRHKVSIASFLGE